MKSLILLVKLSWFCYGFVISVRRT